MKIFKKIRSPYWWVTETVNGKRLRRSTGLPHHNRVKPTRADPVNELLLQFQLRATQRRFGLESPVERVLVDDFAKTFLYGLDVREVTRDGYETYVKALLKSGLTAGRTVDSWTYPDSVAVVEGLTWGSGPKKNLVGFFKSAWKEAGRRGHWTGTANPWDVQVKAVKSTVGRSISSADIELLTGAGCPEMLRTAIWIALLTGCRGKNVTDLTWNDVDFDQGVVLFRESKTGGYCVPLHSRLREILFPLRGDGSACVVKASGRSRSFLSMSFHRRCKEVGVKARFHDLRHTFVTRLAEAGVSKENAKRLSNHKTTSINDHYEHVDVVRLGTDIERVRV